MGRGGKDDFKGTFGLWLVGFVNSVFLHNIANWFSDEFFLIKKKFIKKIIFREAKVKAKGPSALVKILNY